MTLRPSTLSALGAALAAAALALAACGPRSSAPADDSGAAPAAPAAPAMSEAEAKAVLAALPAPYNGADVENGRKQYVKCKACHTLSPDGHSATGPALWGVYGRKAGTYPAYAFSEPLKAAGYEWDAAHLDPWLADPRGTIPGTKMSFIGLKDQKDRIDLIGYLATQGPKKP
jgi:cytochrome c